LRGQNRVMRASPRTEAVAVLAEGGVENRVQHLQQCLLDQPIHHRRDGELALAPSGFGIITPHSFIAQPPHLRRLVLITRASWSLARSPYLAAPSMRFLFIGSRFTLHAFFPHSV